MARVSLLRNRNRRISASEREGPAFVDDLLAMAGSLANSRKEYAAAQLEELADSVRQFTDSMPEIPTVKAYASTAADSLEQLAGYVVESDVAQMVDDMRDFARRHPLATFGGSIALGLAVTQIIQSRAAPMRSGSNLPSKRTRRSSGSGRSRSLDESRSNDAMTEH